MTNEPTGSSPQPPAHPAPAAGSSRRDFMRQSSLLVAGGAVAGGTLSSGLSIARAAHPFGSDTIRLGLIGCGGRGTAAAGQAMNTTGGEVQLVAMGDVFETRLSGAHDRLAKSHAAKVNVPAERRFVGHDAYKNVLSADVDMVILATPPGFRPLHFEAAINAGKHVFMEKPVAVDPPGVRRVVEACKLAKQKELAVAVGLQRRHEQRYQDMIGRVQDGAIGDIVLARAYWNGRTPWIRPRREDMTELEYQTHNWYFFNWICGDHINEQHIHNLDVINWLKNGYPVEAQGQGGRGRRGDQEGQIFDHHFVEFTYADGTKLFSQCRHQDGCWQHVEEYAHGTKGWADFRGGLLHDASGKVMYESKERVNHGHQEEHHDLFAAIRRGERPAEGEYGAYSTMTAILGRMATYTGQVIRWEEALNSTKSLADVDSMASFNDSPPVQPDAQGHYPLPVPGVTKKKDVL